VVGILGIALAVYFYFLSRETPELTYFVHPVKAAVVRTGQMSRLSVQFDGKDLTSDVTAAQVAFWNAGRRAIRSSAILGPLVMRTANKARILEVRLQKTSRDVTGIKVDSSRLPAGKVEIRWDILEKNDGGVLQIVYAGDENVDIVAHAILEGQRDIVGLQYSQALTPPGEQYARRLGWRSWSAVIVFFFMGVFLLLIIALRIRQPRSVIDVILWIEVVLTFGSGTWELLFDRPPVPPFGF
jgi:hypothetical protein